MQTLSSVLGGTQPLPCPVSPAQGVCFICWGVGVWLRGRGYRGAGFKRLFWLCFSWFDFVWHFVGHFWGEEGVWFVVGGFLFVFFLKTPLLPLSKFQAI